MEQGTRTRSSANVEMSNLGFFLRTPSHFTCNNYVLHTANLLAPATCDIRLLLLDSASTTAQTFRLIDPRQRSSTASTSRPAPDRSPRAGWQPIRLPTTPITTITSHSRDRPKLAPRISQRQIHPRPPPLPLDTSPSIRPSLKSSNNTPSSLGFGSSPHAFDQFKSWTGKFDS